MYWLDNSEKFDPEQTTCLTGRMYVHHCCHMLRKLTCNQPFNNIKPDTFEDSNSTWLELIDGSSNLENIPLGPLFVKSRQLDVIIGVDASADEVDNLWPNGTSPISSAHRIATVLNTSHQTFPPLPANQSEFLSTGVNQRPTFFGCNPTQTPPEWPLFIYFPNSPPNNGDDPATKYVLSVYHIKRVKNEMSTAPAPSKLSTTRNSLRFSSTKLILIQSAASNQTARVPTLTGANVCSAQRLTVQDTRSHQSPPAPHSAKPASSSIALIQTILLVSASSWVGSRSLWIRIQ